MAQDTTAKISEAIGIRSVFLAARLDPKLSGRFFHMEGQFLLDRNGSHATKRALADVMVYMAGAYKKEVTLQDVELGLLAASQDYGSVVGQDLEAVVEPEAYEEPVKFVEDEPADDEVVEMESTVEPDWVVNDFKEEAPAPKETRGRPGVKPDYAMIQAMTSGENKLTRSDIHISTLDIALRFYDFIANDLARPESEDAVQHKIKLSIGATMKEIGWKKRMRKGEWGWHPNDDSFFNEEPPEIDVESVLVRKRNQMVEAEEEVPPEVSAKVIADVIPKLSDREVQDKKPKQEQLDPDDDLPWPDEMAGFTDGQPERKTEAVRFINMIEGTEETESREIIFGKTMTFFLDDNGVERMVEWDKDEEAWTFYIEDQAV